MENRYIPPQIEVIEIEVEGVLCGSTPGGFEGGLLSNPLEDFLPNGGFTLF